MATQPLEAARTVFIAGLRNAHAVENQAEELLKRQVERLEHYPKLEARMRQHIEETIEQRRRLDEILGSLGESSSTIKDAAMSIMGNLAAVAHTVAQDEILKNSFANFAFENFEAASYKSLIVVGEAGGFDQALSALKQSLEEELAMARFLDENLREVTLTYLARESAGVTAGV